MNRPGQTPYLLQKTPNRVYDPMTYADPIERPHNPILHQHDVIVILGAVAAVMVLVAFMFVGWVV